MVATDHPLTDAIVRDGEWMFPAHQRGRPGQRTRLDLQHFEVVRAPLIGDPFTSGHLGSGGDQPKGTVIQPGFV